MTTDPGTSASGVPSRGGSSRPARAASLPAPCAISGGVRAFVRLRPSSERSDIDMFEISPNGKVITIKDPLSSGGREHSFEFSSNFGQEATQDEVFSPVVGPIVDAALLGRSGCVMAYGQTGSGKTYSIFGVGTGDQRGLLPRALERLFHGLGEKEKTLGPGSTGMTASFLEVYMDQVRDLAFAASGKEIVAADASDDDEEADGPHRARTWSGRISGSATAPLERASTVSLGGRLQTAPGPLGLTGSPSEPHKSSTAFTAGLLASSSSGRIRPPRGLEVRESPDGTVHVQGLAKLPARNLEELRQIMDRGQARRATATTAVNVQSSRSHTVFTVYLPKMKEDKKGVYLSFVDLAGSERLAKSKAEGTRFQEAMMINSSLTALGKVVLALASDPNVVKHIPYRDSKLTRILSPSLSGSAQVSVLATIHPRVEDYEESLNTLSFADRCKNVSRHPLVSYISADGNQRLKISALQAQVAELKEMLRRAEIGPSGLCRGELAAAGRMVDTVDIAIAEVLAAESKRRSSVLTMASEKAFTEVGNTSKAPSRRTNQAEVMILMALQEERNRQAKHIEKSEKKLQDLEKERAGLEHSSRARLTELQDLKQRKTALDLQLQELQAEIKNLVQAHANAHADQVASFRETMRLDECEDLLQVNHGLRQELLLLERRKPEIEAQLQELEESLVATVRDLSESQGKEVQTLKASLQSDLASKEENNARMLEEMMTVKEEDARKTKVLEDELESMYGLVNQLSSLIVDIEKGIYPIIRQNDGSRVAILPPGLRPRDCSEATHPLLFAAKRKAESTVKHFEQMTQRPFPEQGRLRRLVAAALGHFDVAELGSSNIAVQATTPLHRQVSPTFDRTWDPERYAEGLIQADGTANAERLVASLDTEQLNALGSSLRKRACEAFSISKERAMIVKEVEDGLAHETTQQLLQRLEFERNAQQRAYSDAVERMRSVRTILDSRRSCLLSSRATTPGSSRPGTAKRSHTPQAGSRPSSSAPLPHMRK